LPETGASKNYEAKEEDTFIFPTDRKLIWIADLSSRLSWLFLVIKIFYTMLIAAQYFFIQVPPSDWASIDVVDAVITVSYYLENILYAGFIFLVLQAITEGIYLLMDIREMLPPDNNLADKAVDA
jgi:hypothetical protein